MSASFPRSSTLSPRAALTLVEMLIGMAITLLMMAAVVNLFANISAGVKVRRATMEMSGELRIMRATLFNDLAGATCRALPWTRPDEDQGYIEIIEGRWEDSNPTGLVINKRISQVPGSQIPDPNGANDLSGLGDYDDILALTVRSLNAPFKGRAETATTTISIESDLAEVIWYSVENPADNSLGEPGMRTIYRRALLIAPWFEFPAFAHALSPVEFFRRFDISAHYDASTSRWVANSLGDLTKRENRFAHFSDSSANKGFPHNLLTGAIRANSFPQPDTVGPLRPFGPRFENLTPTDVNRQGEDVMLSNVLAFDLRVLDPGAPLFNYNGAVVEPFGENAYANNPGGFYNDVLSGTLAGFGAYVDLGWDDNKDYPLSSNPLPPNSPVPQFQEAREVGWHPFDATAARGTPAVYDTWSFHYENDGIDQDGDGLVDEGTNGLDDDDQNGVDDLLERETSPPYPVPVRGMQVKVRIYEPDTRQVREATVTRNFVPQ